MSLIHCKDTQEKCLSFRVERFLKDVVLLLYTIKRSSAKLNIKHKMCCNKHDGVLPHQEVGGGGGGGDLRPGLKFGGKNWGSSGTTRGKNWDIILGKRILYHFFRC